jgi:hypothetical protein|nr:MAG TPA: hypothetical protein [Caudoviricetes sp.]
MEEKYIVKGIDMTSIVEVMTSCDVSELAETLDEALFCYIYERIDNGSAPSDSDRISNLRFLRDGLIKVKNVTK